MDTSSLIDNASSMAPVNAENLGAGRGRADAVGHRKMTPTIPDKRRGNTCRYPARACGAIAATSSLRSSMANNGALVGDQHTECFKVGGHNNGFGNRSLIATDPHHIETISMHGKSGL